MDYHRDYLKIIFFHLKYDRFFCDIKTSEETNTSKIYNFEAKNVSTHTHHFEIFWWHQHTNTQTHMKKRRRQKKSYFVYKDLLLIFITKYLWETKSCQHSSIFCRKRYIFFCCCIRVRLLVCWIVGSILLYCHWHTPSINLPNLIFLFAFGIEAYELKSLFVDFSSTHIFSKIYFSKYNFKRIFIIIPFLFFHSSMCTMCIDAI